MRVGVAAPPGEGVLGEQLRRWKRCGEDWATGQRHFGKVVAAAVFMVFATFSSTIALASVAERSTDGALGVPEYLMMNGLAGMVNAAIGAQPLLVHPSYPWLSNWLLHTSVPTPPA